MRIALDISSMARPQATGVAVYARRLVGGLAVVNSLHRFSLVSRISRFRHRHHLVAPPSPDFERKWILEPFNFRFGRQVAVYHDLDARLPGRWMKARLVVTIHDIHSALQSKEFASEAFRKLKQERYQEILDRADRIIVVSESSKRDVVGVLGARPERIRVIHEAGGPAFFQRPQQEIAEVRRQHGLAGPYLIYVGSINKRKNVLRMIQAFLLARRQARSEAVFAIAGRPGFGAEEIGRALEGLEGREHIRLLGYLPDAQVPALYSGATGLLYATLYEGFGLPVVEAFACGCPVLGGNRGSVPEISAGAALLANPEDVEEIASQIYKLLTDQAFTERLRQAGLARAKDFSWERAAKETIRVYQELE